MNATPNQNRTVSNAPQWLLDNLTPRVSPTAAPIMPQSLSRPAVRPESNATQRPASFSSFTVSGPVAALGLSIVFLLVLTVGVLLGRMEGPTHTGTALDVTKTTSVATATSAPAHRVPDQNETTALQQAKGDTGSLCWLSWNVDSYDVMCDTHVKSNAH